MHLLLYTTTSNILILFYIYGGENTLIIKKINLIK